MTCQWRSKELASFVYILAVESDSSSPDHRVGDGPALSTFGRNSSLLLVVHRGAGDLFAGRISYGQVHRARLAVRRHNAASADNNFPALLVECH